MSSMCSPNPHFTAAGMSVGLRTWGAGDTYRSSSAPRASQSQPICKEHQRQHTHFRNVCKSRKAGGGTAYRRNHNKHVLDRELVEFGLDEDPTADYCNGDRRQRVADAKDQGRQAARGNAHLAFVGGVVDQHIRRGDGGTDGRTRGAGVKVRGGLPPLLSFLVPDLWDCRRDLPLQATGGGRDLRAGKTCGVRFDGRHSAPRETPDSERSRTILPQASGDSREAGTPAIRSVPLFVRIPAPGGLRKSGIWGMRVRGRHFPSATGETPARVAFCSLRYRRIRRDQGVSGWQTLR